MTTVQPLLQVVIEGWRRGTHSYALVNQHQLLALAGHPGLDLRHHDLVPPDDDASAHALFNDDGDARLRSIPAPRPGQMADIAYRIAAPFDLAPSPRADRTFVFMTSEHRYVPTSLMAHDEPFASAVARHATHLVTPSHWSRAGLILAGADPERVTVIPHAVDPTIFSPTSMAKRQAWRLANEIDPDAFLFLHVGAMTGNKGILDLLRAFAVIAQVLPNARLVLKGNDALYGSRLRLERLLENVLTPAENSRVLDRLHYIGGRLANAQMAAMYGAADAYVSVYSAEGFNLPVLEAVATGLPVVVTAGGPTDDFVPRECGLFVPATLVSGGDGKGEHLDPDFMGIVEAMGRVALDVDLRRRAADIGPKHVAQSHSWQSVATAMVALFRAAI